MQTLMRRLPGRGEIFPVYSCFIFLSASWMLYRLSWYLPSWIEYLNLGGIAVIAAYGLAYALFESLLLTGVLLLVSLVLPARWMQAQFATQGSLLALAMGAGAVLIQRQVSMIYRWEIWQVALYSSAALLGLLALLLLSAWLFGRAPRLKALMLAVADRMTIFGYIYTPLGIIGLLVVVVRNLLGS